MKDSNEHLETTHHSSEYLNHEDKLDDAGLDKIREIADKESHINHHEIRELTRIILKIDPVEVDEFLRGKFNLIMHKIKAQYA